MPGNARSSQEHPSIHNDNVTRPIMPDTGEVNEETETKYLEIEQEIHILPHVVSRSAPIPFPGSKRLDGNCKRRAFREAEA